MSFNFKAIEAHYYGILAGYATLIETDLQHLSLSKTVAGLATGGGLVAVSVLGKLFTTAKTATAPVSDTKISALANVLSDLKSQFQGLLVVLKSHLEDHQATEVPQTESGITEPGLVDKNHKVMTVPSASSVVNIQSASSPAEVAK